MRKVSVKRKGGRRSSGRQSNDAAENGVNEKRNSGPDATADTDSEENYEPENKKRKSKGDKRKSVSFSAKGQEEAEPQYEVPKRVWDVQV